MTSNPDKESDKKSKDQPDLAQAYLELAKGEKAATALEANLTNLESKLDAILAAFEKDQQERQPEQPSSSQASNQEQQKGK